MAKNNVSDQTKDFYIEQIKTTQKIIKEFSRSKEFSPTMLLNSLLSLVVLPYEKAKATNGEKIFGGTFKQLSKKLDIHAVIFQPIKYCEKNEIKYNNKTIYAFIKKFRNGIAHQNLDVSVDDNKKIWITIYNKSPSMKCNKCSQKYCVEKGLTYQKSGVVDFKITVSVTQLQKLALYIADSYLKSIEGSSSS